MDILKKGPSVLNVIEDSGDVLSILSNRFFVSSDFYDDVTKRFEVMYPNLLACHDYSPAELVGYSYWSGLTDKDRNVCVLILKDFALQDFPLVTDWTSPNGDRLAFFVNYVESVHDHESTDVPSGFEE